MSDKDTESKYDESIKKDIQTNLLLSIFKNSFLVVTKKKYLLLAK